MQDAFLTHCETLQQILSKLIGFHRQLLENVKFERVALANADLATIQEATLGKQNLIDAVRKCELERLQLMESLQPHKGIDSIVIALQGHDLKRADQLRTTHMTLKLLLERVIEQNKDNAAFVQRSLEHVNAMKKNILGETVPKSNTYNQHGQRQSTIHGARMISKEA